MITNTQGGLQLRRPRTLAFEERFTEFSATRGRGGDLNMDRWMTSRLNPDAISGPGINHVRPADIPVCRAGISSTSVFPANDTLVCDSTGTIPGTLMTACVIQEYGTNDYMCLQPFDFSSRTGRITFDCDAWSDGNLGTYINLNITEEPIPACGFHIHQNEEAGPIPKNGLMIEWTQNVTGPPRRNSVNTVLVYNNYTMTTVTPSFSVSGTSCPLALIGSLNHIIVDVSATHLTIYESDYSTDNGVTFPNLRKIWEGDISLSFSTGYIHLALRNHSTTKFGFTTTGVYHWDNFTFDGPLIRAPRMYEFPDNTTTGHNSSPPPGLPEYDYVSLGWQVSDGSGRAEGIWNPSSNVSPLSSSQSVNLSSATSALLSFNLFVNSVTHTSDATWGLKYKFNGGTWRTRNLTTLEYTALNGDAGCAGYLSITDTVSLGDLVNGINTLDFSSVNVPMDFAPIVTNISLLVYTP